MYTRNGIVREKGTKERRRNEWVIYRWAVRSDRVKDLRTDEAEEDEKVEEKKEEEDDQENVEAGVDQMVDVVAGEAEKEDGRRRWRTGEEC